MSEGKGYLVAHGGLRVGTITIGSLPTLYAHLYHALESARPHSPGENFDATPLLHNDWCSSSGPLLNQRPVVEGPSKDILFAADERAFVRFRNDEVAVVVIASGLHPSAKLTVQTIRWLKCLRQHVEGLLDARPHKQGGAIDAPLSQ